MKTENAAYAHCFAQCGPMAKPQDPQDLVKCTKAKSKMTAKWQNRKSEAMRHAKCIQFPLLCLPEKSCHHSPHPPAQTTPHQRPGEKKRLSTSRYDFGVSSIIKRRPSEDRALSPQREAEALSSEGLLFIMQDTPKSHLEVERRFFSEKSKLAS